MCSPRTQLDLFLCLATVCFFVSGRIGRVRCGQLRPTILHIASVWRSVCQSVCMSVCNAAAPYKSRCTDRGPAWSGDSWGPGNIVLDGDGFDVTIAELLWSLARIR